jgi:tripartite-type tricarboxylate transporter receptor subunit TctC
MLVRCHALAVAPNSALGAILPADAQPADPGRPVKILAGYASGGGMSIVAC